MIQDGLRSKINKEDRQVTHNTGLPSDIVLDGNTCLGSLSIWTDDATMSTRPSLYLSTSASPHRHHSTNTSEVLSSLLKVICNGFSQNWWKVVSSCLLQYKPVYVINIDKLRCKMLKSKRLVVFLYSYSLVHRHAWRHIRMCLFLFALLLRLDKKLFCPFLLLKSLSVSQKCYI